MSMNSEAPLSGADTLDILLEKARTHKISRKEREEQVVSWILGQFIDATSKPPPSRAQIRAWLDLPPRPRG